MLKWFRKRGEKQPAPTWSQLYVIYTMGPGALAWAEAFSADSPVKCQLLTPAEANEFLDVARSCPPSDKVPFAECAGAMLVGAVYERNEKVFLTIAQTACQLAMRETGYLTSVRAQATYRAARWLKCLKKFDLWELASVHFVQDAPPSETLWVHSHGLVQFDLPEVEVKAVPRELAPVAAKFVAVMGEWMFSGERLGDGHTLEAPWNPGVWATCESVMEADNDGHGEPDYALLRFSDYDQNTGQKSTGLARFLSGLGPAPASTADAHS